MSRRALALAVAVLGVTFVAMCPPAMAGNFLMGAFYDPYSRDTLVADRDSMFAQMKDFGIDWVVSIGDSITTRYAQQYGFQLYLINEAAPIVGNGIWRAHPTKLRDAAPQSFEELAKFSYRSPEYQFEGRDAVGQLYRFDSTVATGRPDQQGRPWRECVAGTHDSGWALPPFAYEPTHTNALSKWLIANDTILPIHARVIYYLAIGDTTPATDTALRIDFLQVRNYDTGSCTVPLTSSTTRGIFPQDFSAPFDPELPVFDTFSVEVELHGEDCGWESHQTRLWWFGGRSVYIDKVEVVTDGTQDYLWSANGNLLADSLVKYYNSLRPASVVADMQLIDEPWGGDFRTLQRGQALLDIAKDKPGGVPIRMATSHGFPERWPNLEDWDSMKVAGVAHYFNPHRFNAEVYPFACFTTGSSDGVYDSTNLQFAFDRARGTLSFEREITHWAGVRFSPLLTTGLFRHYDESGGCFETLMREITPAELLCLASMAMCFLPDEIGYYFYASSVCDPGSRPVPRPEGTEWMGEFEGVTQGPCACSGTMGPRQYTALVNFDTTGGGDCVHTTQRTPKWYTMRTFSHWADSLADLFYNFTRVASMDVDDIPSTPGLCLDSVQSVTFGPSGKSTFAEAGFFQLSGIDYFMLINRRCQASESQTLRAWIDRPSGMYHVIDVYSYDTVLTGSLPTGGIPFTTTLAPGEGKLYKIVSGPASISGSSFPMTWQGGISVASNVTVESSRSLTILPPADIRVTGGGGYTFDVYGNLSAQGTASDTIRFRSSLATPGRQDWYGIKQLGPGNVKLQYVQIRDAYNGLKITSTATVDTITVDHCDIRHGQVTGVYSEANASSKVTISNSHIADIMSYGVEVYKGQATLQANRFTDSMLYGIFVYGSPSWMSGAKILSNSFDSLRTNNAWGIYLQSLYNDGYSSSDTLIQYNTFGPTWLNGGQGSIQISNCSDSGGVQVYRTSVRWDWLTLPTYGIMNYSTKTRIFGDHAVAESLSAIRGPRYAVYCVSTSGSDPDYATLRNISIEAGHVEPNPGYCIWIYSNSKVDVGSQAESGGNALYGYDCNACVPSCISMDPGASTVYNMNTTYVDSARGNYWGNKYCPKGRINSSWPYTSGLVDTSGMLASNPFADPLGKLIAEQEEENLGEGVRPYQTPPTAMNFPNPLNSSTVIRFTVPQDGEVAVHVFNVLGQHVRTLWKGLKPAGEQAVIWDGRTDYGAQVSSGVYFYRVEMPNAQLTKKMVVVK